MKGTTKLHGAVSDRRPWTPEESAAIRDRYLKEGAKQLADQLGRSVASVMHKAGRMRVLSHRRWTAADDQHLKALWGTNTVGHIARALKRSPGTTYWRAQKLGLELGAPRGLEYLTTAAERTGFDRSTLSKVLAWAGVKTMKTSGRPTKKRVAYRYRVVDPFDVDEAIARWLKTEELYPAARARGISGCVLRDWLLEAGVPVGRVLNAGADDWHRRRIESSVIDAVVASRSGKRSLSSEARRVGVPVGTLRGWLLMARLAGTESKPWRLDPKDVDRVVAERRGQEKAA